MTDNTPDLPDVTVLSRAQVTGAACARCGEPLYGMVDLGVMYDAVTGDEIRLWGCLPCATPAELDSVLVARVQSCVLCRRPADNPVVIGRVAGNSGPGWTQYAHRACASMRGYKVLGA